MVCIMPFMLVLFLYIVLEGLAFVGITNLIGLGWTLLLLLATMLFGMTVASLEVRRIMHGKTTRTEDGSVIMEDATPGRTAGNVGLTLAGGVLLSLPGFLTTFLGILLILPPTRALLRTLLSVKLFKSVENMGVRFYDASPMSSQHDSYGSFGTAGTSSTQPSAAQESEVIDEDEIRNWSQSLSPEDFGGNGGNGSYGTDGSSRG